MILSCFLAALGQMSDPRFLRVMGLGVLLAAALLMGVYAGFIHLVGWLTPERVELPWVGEVTWVTDLLGWGSILLMIGLSVFLMVPVAALFSGLFLDDIARAVEDRHYPHLPVARKAGLYEGLKDAVNFFGVLVAVNALALVLYALVGPFAPLLFWVVNGYLLGREYFQLVAARRLDRAAAKALRKAHRGTIWLAGCLMAAPLSLPLVNLVIPVLGVATFTHLVQRLVPPGARAG